MKFHLMIVLLLCTLILRSQQISTSYLMNLKPTLVETYKRTLKLPYSKITMEFGDDSIQNKAILSTIGYKSVIEVDLIYSDYKEVKSFDQPELNKSRYDELRKLAPSLFENTAVNWVAYSQTGCNSAGACAEYFHGFYIYFLPPPTKASMKLEIEFLSNVMKEKDTVIAMKSPIISHRYISSYYEPILNSKKEKGIHYSNPSIWNRKEVKVYESYHRTITQKISIYDESKTESGILTPGYITYKPDTVILGVLNRQKSWKNMVVVEDVTGSMSPYSAQVMKWLILNQNINRVRSFIFFNDGDMKSDITKQIGNTGGIYFAKDASLRSVIHSMHHAMSNGYGGDSPENDIEAILQAQETFPDAEEFILIADNFSNMRDIKLMNKIVKPVRVIICGGYYSINTQYLELARITGGSVHTMEDDLYNLGKLNEGETITINKVTYKIQNGRFVLYKI